MNGILNSLENYIPFKFSWSFIFNIYNNQLLFEIICFNSCFNQNYLFYSKYYFKVTEEMDLLKLSAASPTTGYYLKSYDLTADNLINSWFKLCYFKYTKTYNLNWSNFVLQNQLIPTHTQNMLKISADLPTIIINNIYKNHLLFEFNRFNLLYSLNSC